MNTLRPQGNLRAAGLLCTFALSLVALTTAAAQQPQPTPTPADNEYQVGAILWTQTSGEIRALYYQAFKLARLVLDQDLKHKSKLRRAVVVDIDETVLDNSPQQAWLVRERKEFNQPDWAAWVKLADAQPLPGAVEFLRYADAKGVRVFYISNRKEEERAGTMANLRKFNFPNVTDETVLLRGSVSSKEPRRKQVAAQHRIVLLMGDNLNDFAEVFEKRTVAERLAAVEQNRDQFGTQFIMLPNAMYGDWESAIYSNPTPSEPRAVRRRNTLKAFTPQP
ncbi:MAG TPA: 5'-nucleotidase, lipoprotein e(P4) family [Pyrinomonadaceae bacterium]|nr:5'-nucleotidase, lipoprotein e(P4) family [Pyrinomonadaceae bacterium]